MINIDEISDNYSSEEDGRSIEEIESALWKILPEVQASPHVMKLAVIIESSKR
jgi:hypothetical protein